MYILVRMAVFQFLFFLISWKQSNYWEIYVNNSFFPSLLGKIRRPGNTRTSFQLSIGHNLYRAVTAVLTHRHTCAQGAIVSTILSYSPRGHLFCFVLLYLRWPQWVIWVVTPALHDCGDMFVRLNSFCISQFCQKNWKRARNNLNQITLKVFLSVVFKLTSSYNA